MTKILIADDHPIVSSTLREMFSPDGGYQVLCKTPTNSDELMDVLEANAVDLLITDYCMPRQCGMPPPRHGDGARMIHHISRKYPHLKIIVFTSITQAGILRMLCNHPHVLGVLSKCDHMSEMRACVDRCRRGMRFQSGIVQSILNSPTDRSRKTSRPLSPKESEVLRMYLCGNNVSEIAASLCRSAKTINNQKRMAMAKLGVRNDMELYQLHATSPLDLGDDNPPQAAA